MLAVVEYDAIALHGVLHAVVPGEIELVHRAFAEHAHRGAAVVHIEQQVRHRFGGFADQKPVPSVRNALRGAAVLDQHARKPVRRRLAHHDAVGIEGGGEEEQIACGVYGAQRFAVADRADELAFLVERQAVHVVLDLPAVESVADEHRRKALARVLQHAQRVEDDPLSLVPHHAPDEQIGREIRIEAVRSAHLVHGVRARAAFRHVDAVRHHEIVALVADRAQVFARALADHPDVVAGGNVVHDDLQRRVLNELQLDRLAHVDVELRVIGEDQRHIARFAHDAAQLRRNERAVHVHDVHRKGMQPFEHLGVERIAGTVADELGRVHARVADDLVGIVVLHVRIGGRHNRRRAVVRGDDVRIVLHHVRHAVEHRRERVVQKADVQIIHTKLLSGGIVPLYQLFPPLQPIRQESASLSQFRAVLCIKQNRAVFRRSL